MPHTVQTRRSVMSQPTNQTGKKSIIGKPNRNKIFFILRYFDDSDGSLMKTNRSDEAEMYVPPITFDQNSTFSKEFLTYTNRKGDHHHLRNTEAYKEWLCAKMYVFGF